MPYVWVSYCHWNAAIRDSRHLAYHYASLIWHVYASIYIIASYAFTYYYYITLLLLNTYVSALLHIHEHILSLLATFVAHTLPCFIYRHGANTATPHTLPYRCHEARHVITCQLCHCYQGQPLLWLRHHIAAYYITPYYGTYVAIAIVLAILPLV